MNKVFLQTIVYAGLLLTQCIGAATFVDEFDGTAADPDPAKWYPNERGPSFDNYLQDGVLHMDCIGGGADNGGHYYQAGPRGKQSIEHHSRDPRVWSWEVLYMSPQPDVGNGQNNSDIDVLITPYAPDEYWDNYSPSHASKVNYVGCRVGLYDGVVTFMELDNAAQYLVHNYDIDGRSAGVWTMTFPADLATEPVTIEFDLAGDNPDAGPVLLHSQMVHGNNIDPTQQYPQFRHYNQTGWAPYYTAADTSAQINYLRGVTGEPPLFCGDVDTVYLLGDLDEDCYISVNDVALFATQWMKCTDPTGGQCIVCDDPNQCSVLAGN